jgi:hypothetical protein
VAGGAARRGLKAGFGDGVAQQLRARLAVAGDAEVVLWRLVAGEAGVVDVLERGSDPEERGRGVLTQIGDRLILVCGSLVADASGRCH